MLRQVVPLLVDWSLVEGIWFCSSVMRSFPLSLLFPENLDLHRSQIDRDYMQRAIAHPAVDLCDLDGADRTLDYRSRRLKLVLVAVEDSELLPYRVEHLVDE